MYRKTDVCMLYESGVVRKNEVGSVANLLLRVFFRYVGPVHFSNTGISYAPILHPKNISISGV